MSNGGMFVSVNSLAPGDMESQNFVKNSLGNHLLPNGSKPLPELALTQ